MGVSGGIKNVGGLGKKAIVIGENMLGRVIPEAKEIGADYYKPRSSRDFEQAMEKNRRWINDKMREGRKIVDIGPDPERATRSPFYEMEKREIMRKKYPISLD